MVAVINTGKSIRRALQYNENKLKEGVATLLSVSNCPFSEQQSNVYLRLKLLEKVAALRQDVSVNSLHISLNFSPKEQLSDRKMQRIAKDYMQKIGFGEQPFFVFRHHDAGHDHCHIVTTNITLQGDRISLHRLANLKSEPARMELENEYGLIKAVENEKEHLSIKPADATKIKYGKTATKRGIGNVLAQVLGHYKFTSIPELNAVLNLYNVHADTGKEGSRLNRYQGLQYSVLDADGSSIGVPIKASLFYNKPTLKNLQKLFVKNDVARQQYKKRLQTTIAFLLKTRKPKSLNDLKVLLYSDDIRLIPRLNKNGVIFGITYVDLKTKCVFNGSALGKQYSAKALLASIHFKDEMPLEFKEALTDSNVPRLVEKESIAQNHQDAGAHRRELLSGERTLLELLTQYEFAASSVPYEWKKKKKRKKKTR